MVVVAAAMPGMLWPRWIFLRALGLMFGSAFYSLLFQIRGLIGERGILPATPYLRAIRDAIPGLRAFWVAPTLFWISTGDRALMLIVSAGLAAAVLLTVNIWPRLMIAVCVVAFLSCIAALQDFSSYQSDGMLLQAGLASLFLAPSGVRPGLGAHSPPSRASIWLLRWEWFAIYFESGLVEKVMSGNVQWRTLTGEWTTTTKIAHSPRGPAGTSSSCLTQSMQVPSCSRFPRAHRPLGAVHTAPTSSHRGGRCVGLPAMIITTANYAFLNYLVLSLGVFLVDDQALTACGQWVLRKLPRAVPTDRIAIALRRVSRWPFTPTETEHGAASTGLTGRLSVAMLVVTLYVGIIEFLPFDAPPVLRTPARLLAPFRVVNAYGLFAVMTTAEYEIEFQGRRGDTTWIAYPFRYKPQNPSVAPGIYAPYQPRFEWNLWFASLGPWSDNQWVVSTQAQLLGNDPSVLALFAGNPFASTPPKPCGPCYGDTGSPTSRHVAEQVAGGTASSWDSTQGSSAAPPTGHCTSTRRRRVSDP